MKTATHTQRKAPTYGTGFEGSHKAAESKVFTNWYGATNRIQAR